MLSLLPILLLSLVPTAKGYIYSDGRRPAYPTDKDIVQGCTYYVNVDAGLLPTGSSCGTQPLTATGQICLDIEKYYGITGDQFRSQFNPSVTQPCTNLIAGHSYCVSVDPQFPQPRQPGIAPNCQRYYYVVTGDTCNGIVSAYGNTFTLQQFYAWNTQTGNDCRELLADEWACVGV